MSVKFLHNGSIAQYVLSPSVVRDINRITFDELDELLLGVAEEKLSLKARLFHF